jgi:hypothetical protein
MDARALMVGLLGLQGMVGATCQAPSSAENESSPPANKTPTSRDPAVRASDRRAPDLEWDSARGWEIAQPWPPGEMITKRDAALYLNLAYASLDEPDIFRMLLGAPPGLSDRSLIVPHEDLCHPSLAPALEGLAPSRLLLKIEGDPTGPEWDCLAALPDVDLYLTLCPNDGIPLLYRCDGDAHMDAMLARPDLRRRVRGLAVSFQDARHWGTLATFPRLQMLTLQGPAIVVAPEATHVEKICALPDLAYVDILDAAEPSHRAELPLPCIFGLETYIGWSFVPEWTFDASPPVGFPACRLRRIDLFSIAERDRPWLAACADAEIESAEEAYERYKEERRQRDAAAP